jgi:excinuclease UvrABC helicase subunit UvrB
MLDLLEENEKQSGFYLKGWALTETSGQLFLNQLNKNLAKWHYRISDQQFKRGQGRVQTEGYILEVWLTHSGDQKG